MPTLEDFLTRLAPAVYFSQLDIKDAYHQLELDEGSREITTFISHSLTDTEKRYCQTEKEALALVWGVERFSVYLIGRVFELETDHKPLETIFRPNYHPCLRIERWLLRLQAFRFTVVYRKGSQNIADPLSRLCVDDPLYQNNTEDDSDNAFMILAISESVAIDVIEIENAIKNDEDLIKLKQYMDRGYWGDDLKQYRPFKDEFGYVGNMIIRRDKMVIPKILQNRILELAHEGHPGEVVMKRRLRARTWWPGMDRQAEEWVKRCEGCQLVAKSNVPEPMLRKELPTAPWSDVAVDFLGPLPTGEYLFVIVDYYSRYKEVEIMLTITAKETIERLRKIFVRLGYPYTITLDNGRQFISRELQEFCKIHKINLNFTTPYWPQENGEIERQNRSLLKRLKISHVLGSDWKRDLDDYLVMYYSTPHSITGRTPTELCIGRTIRTKIPSIGDIENRLLDHDEIADKDWEKKQKGKEREDDRRNAKLSDITVGDVVWMKNLIKKNKLTSQFNPERFVVVDRCGSMVRIKSMRSGKTFERNLFHVKKIPLYSSSVELESEIPSTSSIEPEPSTHTECLEDSQPSLTNTPPTYRSSSPTEIATTDNNSIPDQDNQPVIHSTEQSNPNSIDVPISSSSPIPSRPRREIKRPSRYCN